MKDLLTKPHILALLIFLAYTMFPLDFATIFTFVFGWAARWVVFIILLGILLYLAPGRTFKQKSRYIWKKVTFQ